MDFSPGKSSALRSPISIGFSLADPGRWMTPGIGLVALLLALAIQPGLPIDSAGGALARAERFFADGGVGAVGEFPTLSDPLGSFLLAGARALGVDVLAGSRFLVALAFGVTVAALSAAVQVAGGGLVAALLAAALACAWAPFRAPLLAAGGLGSTTALSLLAMLVAIRSRPRVTGILYGLALFESPIAVAALAGPVGASLWIGGVVPRQILATAGLTYLASTGLRVLISGTGWISGGARDPIDSQLADGLLGGSTEVALAVLLLVLATVRLVCTSRRDEPSEIVVVSAAVWCGFGVILAALGVLSPFVASAILAPPLVLLALSAPAAIARRASARSDLAAAAAWSLAGMALLGASLSALAGESRHADTRRSMFDRDRLEAGRWLASVAGESESLSTTSSWTAFGARELDLRGTTSSARAEYSVQWGHREAGQVVPPTVPPGYVPLAIFDGAYRRFDDLPWVTVFGREGSRGSLTGTRAYTLRDLDPPVRIPGVPPPNRIAWRGADLFEHPSGGLRFTVPAGGRRFSIRFRPAFASETPRDQTDGVTFELSAAGIPRFRHYLYGDDPEPEVVVRVVDRAVGAEPTLDLVVGVGPAQNGRNDWALWRGVRIFVEGIDPANSPADLPTAADAPAATGDEAPPDTGLQEDELIP